METGSGDNQSAVGASKGGKSTDRNKKTSGRETSVYEAISEERMKSMRNLKKKAKSEIRIAHKMTTI